MLDARYALIVAALVMVAIIAAMTAFVLHGDAVPQSFQDALAALVGAVVGGGGVAVNPPKQ